mmetsp:Transcript_5390/g.8022  ORF Transcript_5390/g.8022 Transcript_5390/m.8022 type:complete len:106 (-) Transcript_5390:134-451(-)
MQDGWHPLCTALKLSVPQTEFPHRNKRTLEFASEFGFDSRMQEGGGLTREWLLTAIVSLFNLVFPLAICGCFCCRSSSSSSSSSYSTQSKQGTDGRCDGIGKKGE